MRRSILALVAVLSLVGAACGGHDDADTAESTTSAATDGGEGTGSGDDAPGTFGTLESPVCGPGDASGATDQGVTDDAIKVGVLSDSDNDFTPGLLKELVDASEAFVEWCNEAGGINGRRIELTVRDTRLIEAANAVAEACSEDFMLVGGGTAFDGSIFESRVACGLPEITAFHNSEGAAGADLSVQPVVRFPGYEPVTIYRLAAEHLPEAAAHFGLISYESFGGSVSFTDSVPVAAEPVGITTVYTGNFPTPPATVDNYRPYIEDMSSKGTRLFATYVPPETMVPLMVAMADAGLELDGVLGNRSQYSSSLIAGNDSLDDYPTWVETIVYPFELAADNPPTQQFLQIMDAHISGWSNDPKALAVEAFSSWLLWAKAATECGSDLSRDCVLEKAESVGTWDGGGITSPQEVPSQGSPSAPFCAAILRATTDGFVYDEELTQPNEGIFNCDEANQQPFG
jgi:ABC-type branched-subunit amino acid transport system substrate-binding protein